MKKILCFVLVLFLSGVFLNASSLSGKSKKGFFSKSTTTLLKKKNTKNVVSKTKNVVKSLSLSPTRHSVHQKINRNVSTKDELSALKKPLEVKPVKTDTLGRQSQRYIGEKSEVAINPLTGKIVSVNPTSTKKVNKLKGKND